MPTSKQCVTMVTACLVTETLQIKFYDYTFSYTVELCAPKVILVEFYSLQSLQKVF